MPTPIWEPGKSAYGEYLKTLTKEQRAEHMNIRRARKSMKDAFKLVIAAQQEVWLAKINNAFESVINKAILEGDANALATVHDRLVGKPDQAVDVTSKGQQVQAPTIIFSSKELPEWCDEKTDK
jgi:hypothetical protein